MRIIYIEDDVETSETVKKILEKSYYIVDCEVDGNCGFNKICRNNYDLAIIDINLPTMCGLDICKELRLEHNNIPIIFLTSNIDDKSLLQALKFGADDYIKKPFSKEELLLRIENILKRSNSNMYLEDKLKCNNFSLDFNLKILFFKNNSINLTKKEFNILELFFRNQNIIISREKIFYNVWDENDNPFSNIVEVFIESIRRKIKVHTTENLIKNKKCFGYYIGKID